MLFDYFDQKTAANAINVANDWPVLIYHRDTEKSLNEYTLRKSEHKIQLEHMSEVSSFIQTVIYDWVSSVSGQMSWTITRSLKQTRQPNGDF